MNSFPLPVKIISFSLHDTPMVTSSLCFFITVFASDSIRHCSFRTCKSWRKHQMDHWSVNVLVFFESEVHSRPKQAVRPLSNWIYPFSRRGGGAATVSVRNSCSCQGYTSRFSFIFTLVPQQQTQSLLCANTIWATNKYNVHLEINTLEPENKSNCQVYMAGK